MNQVSAYILIETAPGLAGKIAESLRGLPGINASNAVTGPYDVICSVVADSLSELGKNIVTRIQGLDGVLRTLTCLVVDQ